MRLSANSELKIWPDHAPADVQYSLRSFATELCDLNVDFAGARQPYLVTQLLSNCVLREERPLAEDEVWCWSLKKRLQALLAIAIKTRGSRLVLHAICPDPACGERIELPLDLTMFQQADLEETFVFDIDGRALQVRLPNGADQRRWLQHREEAVTALAKNLVIKVDGVRPGDDWHFRDEWIDDFSVALEAHDALMTLQLNSACPACGRELKIAVDLEAQLLTSLSQVQRQLLLDVHLLALAYHWSERDVLALPTRRRHFYLMQLQDGSGEALLQ